MLDWVVKENQGWHERRSSVLTFEWAEVYPHKNISTRKAYERALNALEIPGRESPWTSMTSTR